jgi:hypothetical protein
MFADSGIEYETAVYIADPQNGKLGVQSAMNRAIWRAFHENGISIPYPQRGADAESGDATCRGGCRTDERFRAERAASKSGKKRMSDPRDPVEYRVVAGADRPAAPLPDNRQIAAVRASARLLPPTQDCASARKLSQSLNLQSFFCAFGAPHGAALHPSFYDGEHSLFDSFLIGPPTALPTGPGGRS